jgi:hypothetical protein
VLTKDRLRSRRANLLQQTQAANPQLAIILQAAMITTAVAEAIKPVNNEPAQLKFKLAAAEQRIHKLESKATHETTDDEEQEDDEFSSDSEDSDEAPPVLNKKKKSSKAKAKEITLQDVIRLLRTRRR